MGNAFYLCICVCVYVCMYVCVHADMRAHVHAPLHACGCVCVALLKEVGGGGVDNQIYTDLMIMSMSCTSVCVERGHYGLLPSTIHNA